MIPARDRGCAGVWASLRRCFLLWMEVRSFPTSPASPAGPVGCLWGLVYPRLGRVLSWQAGERLVCSQKLLCAEEGPPSPSVPFSGPVCQMFSFQGLLAFCFCSKPICETRFQNLSDVRKLSDNMGSSSVCFLVLTCFNPSPCLNSFAAVSFF